MRKVSYYKKLGEKKEKKKPNIRRRLALLAAGACVGTMVLMSVCGLAAAYPTGGFVPVSQPSETDRATMTVYGVGSGAEVVAYHIVEPYYNDYGFVDYVQNEASKKISAIMETTDARGNVLFDNPSYENIAKLTQGINANTNNCKNYIESIVLKYDPISEAYYTNEAEAGSYLVLVEHEVEGYIYNPMWLSNYYTDANEKTSLTGSSIDAATAIAVLQGSEAYAKKDSTFLTKDIVNPSTGNTKVDDERVGDTVTFDITTVTPDYSDGFVIEGDNKIRFTISDRQSDGLAVVEAENIHVYLDEVADQNEMTKNFTKTVDIENNGWVINFAPEWVRNNPNQTIIIRYSTVIDEDAVTADESNPNIARLDYTTVHGEKTYIEDKTRHYTFEINAIKTDADDVPLAGATFELQQLTENNANGAGKVEGIVYEAVSDADGYLNFYGLEEGTYRLYETKAPKGFTINNSTWTVIITPIYDASTNTITSYTVNIAEDGVDTEGVTYTYTVDQFREEDLRDVVTIKESMKKDVAIISIPDTKLLKLPSVGGNGVFLFLAGGILLFSVALFVSFYVKKNEK